MRCGLYKRARENTGEHWAEKVASEICELLDLPTHQVRLAEYEGVAGCAVRSFLNHRETLIHGNELLHGALEGYDKENGRGSRITTLIILSKPSNTLSLLKK